MTDFMKKILWATDFSDEAHEAYSFADAFAKTFGAEIFGLHVIPGFSPEHYQSAIVVIDELKKRMDHMRSVADEKFKSFQKAQDVTFEYQVKDGNAAKIIVETAEELEVDLIVIGRKGLSAVERLFIGNVANQVLRNSTIPILVTKKESGKLNLKKILVPTDFSEQEEVERDYAWEIAKGFDADITLLHILELHDYEFPPRVLEEMLDSVLKKLKQRKRREKEDIKITEDVTRAIDAPVGIVDYVETNKIDLIVISTCAQSKLERFLLGSTTEKIISHSPIPIFAIPPKHCN
jgi:nucleotide-binding universal stress UspA family protein